MSISFDRAADYYDATRGYPPAASALIAAAIAAAANAGPAARWFEPGVGTGRIAVPLIRRGVHYTGVALSPRMLAVLRARLDAEVPGWPTRVQLVEEDMTALTLPEGTFDVAIAVHVFHLVASWQDALQQILRVLRRPAVLLHCWDGRALGAGEPDIPAAWSRIRAEVLQSHRETPSAASSLRHAAGRRAAIAAFLGDRGVLVEDRAPVTWQEMRAPLADMERIAARVQSNDWSMPDDAFAAGIDRLRAWAAATYGARLSEPRPVTHLFHITRASLPAGVAPLGSGGEA